MKKKLQLFESYVLSKLRYSIASAWLSKSDLRRVDGFQANCLRRLMGLPPPHISRVSNERVRTMAGQQAFSRIVEDLQVGLLDRVLQDPTKQELRDVAFVKKTM